MDIKSIKIKPGYILRELGGEFCIIFENDSNNGALTNLPSINETGIYLWTKLEQGYTATELIDALMEKNNILFEDAQEDVGEFLAKLLNGKIVDFTR